MRIDSDFIILGAGPAGLGAGIALEREKAQGLILEKETEAGGLFRNQTVHGCDFDFGPKILILDESENSKDLLSFLGANYDKYPMRESVYLSEYGLLDFPLQRNLIDLPVDLRNKIINEIKALPIHPSRITSYKDWLVCSYGTCLSELVLIPFEEKKWQIDLSTMGYEWALTRPVKVSRDEVIQGSERKLAPNRYYYYPTHGNISTLSREMSAQSCPILTCQEVTRLDPKNKQIISNGKEYFYKHLISTVPLDDLLRITGDVPDILMTQSGDYLKRLSILVFNLVFKGNFDLKGSALYFPERRFVFRRVTILQNLCPALYRKGFTPISVEVSVQDIGRIDQKKLLHQICTELPLVPQFASIGEPIDYAVLPIDFAYPMQINGLSAYIRKVRNYFENMDIFLCGRGGMFDYCNSDQAYKQGKEVVYKILHHEKQ